MRTKRAWRSVGTASIRSYGGRRSFDLAFPRREMDTRAVLVPPSRLAKHVDGRAARSIRTLDELRAVDHSFYAKPKKPRISYVLYVCMYVCMYVQLF
jgi:hypothetical protein